MNKFYKSFCNNIIYILCKYGVIGAKYNKGCICILIFLIFMLERIVILMIYLCWIEKKLFCYDFILVLFRKNCNISVSCIFCGCIVFF